MPEEPSPAGGRGQGEGGSNSRKARRGGANHPHPNPLPGGEGDTGRLSSYAIPVVRCQGDRMCPNNPLRLRARVGATRGMLGLAARTTLTPTLSRGRGRYWPAIRHEPALAGRTTLTPTPLPPAGEGDQDRAQGSIRATVTETVAATSLSPGSVAIGAAASIILAVPKVGSGRGRPKPG